MDIIEKEIEFADGKKDKVGYLEATEDCFLYLPNCMELESVYMLSFFMRSEADTSIFVNGIEVEIHGGSFARYFVQIRALSTSLEITIPKGTYYLYKFKLEHGNVLTDWTQTDQDISDAIAKEGFSNWCYENDITHIDGGKIYTGTVTAKQIAGETITGDKIAGGTITGNNIAGNTITGDKIKANSITAEKIDVTNLFAQDITASGTITGVNIEGASGTFTKGFFVSIPQSDVTDFTVSCNDSNMEIGTNYHGAGVDYSTFAIRSNKTFFAGVVQSENFIECGNTLKISAREIVFDNFKEKTGAVGEQNGVIFNSFSEFKSGLSMDDSNYLDGTLSIGRDAKIVANTANYATKTVVSGGSLNATYFGSDSSNTGQTTFLRGNDVRLYSCGGGGVYLGASGSTAVTSDENLKDLYPMSKKFDKFFELLEPKLYKYKDTEKNKHHRKHIGFGARAVEKALTKAGLTTEDFAGIVKQEDVTICADEMGTSEDVHFDELYNLRYEEFIALNTAQIQKANKRITELENENKELRKRLERIEKLIDKL